MASTITDVVQQFKSDWTRLLEPAAIRLACRAVGYRWRERLLDPVVTLQLFLVTGSAWQHGLHASSTSDQAGSHRLGVLSDTGEIAADPLPNSAACRE